jgi:cbb3-type cytochrome oxidase maturation protein
MATTVALFAAGIALGIAAAFVWAWGVRTGQFRDLERTKEQLFWPDIAPTDHGTKREADREK